MPRHKILISGACGVTSRAVITSLKASDKFNDSEFYGIDTCEIKYGLYENKFKKIYKVPHCNDDGYKTKVLSLIEELKIDIFIVVPELEVLFWSKNNPEIAFLPQYEFCEKVSCKLSLYNFFEGTSLIPKFTTNEQQIETTLEYPLWMRDYSTGGTSAKGALLVNNKNEIEAWKILNPGVDNFIYSEFLPGKNIAVSMIFNEGKLLNFGIYERLKYIMAKVAPSNITGNISEGKLVDDTEALETALSSVRQLESSLKIKLKGMITVDLKGAEDGSYKITEINLRQVAASVSFSKIKNNNLSENLANATIGNFNEINLKTTKYPTRNLILRDVDGEQIFVENYNEPESI